MANTPRYLALTADDLCWDAGLRELRVAGQLVKRFKQPASCQELILETFQELGWPPVIDDPLPRHPTLAPKYRLHHTITNLNRCQKVIRFYGNGTGEAVCWVWRRRATPERRQSYGSRRRKAG